MRLFYCFTKERKGAMSKRRLSRGLGRQEERNKQFVFSVPKVGEVIVINGSIERPRNPYMYYDEDAMPKRFVPPVRYVGRVKAVTSRFVLLSLADGKGEKSFYRVDFEFKHITYVVVNENCLFESWSYDELDLSCKKVRDNVVEEQVLLGVRHL